MSKSDYVLALPQEAYDDLVNIQNYTYSEYGEKKYGTDLDKSLAHILSHPLSGRRRDDVPEEYLVWPVREHVIIYRIQKQNIYVVRVLHARMDFRFQFQ